MAGCRVCRKNKLRDDEFLRGVCGECDMKMRTCTECGEVLDEAVFVSVKDGKEVGRGHRECLDREKRKDVLGKKSNIHHLLQVYELFALFVVFSMLGILLFGFVLSGDTVLWVSLLWFLSCSFFSFVWFLLLVSAFIYEKVIPYVRNKFIDTKTNRATA